MKSPGPLAAKTFGVLETPKVYSLFPIFEAIIWHSCYAQGAKITLLRSETPLAGTWRFRLDPDDLGEHVADQLDLPWQHDARWMRADYDDAAWPEIRVPACWQTEGYAYNGAAWYRRPFDLPPAEAGGQIVDDGQQTCGVEANAVERVGRMEWQPPEGEYNIHLTLRQGNETLAENAYSLGRGSQ